MMRVLITGGSGYLGQFLIASLQKIHTVGYTYLANGIPELNFAAQGFKVDLATGEGVQAAVLQFKPQIVINCAAISQPAACERDYEACKAVNVPNHLVEALQQLQQRHGITALIIHISTDQVYDGSRSYWTEDAPTHPVNAYGRSKLEAEQYLQQTWPGRYLVLRSSLIYGPLPPLQPVGRPLFVQFVKQILAKQQETSFFVDEYRSAVYVHDICNVIQHVIFRYKPSTSSASPAQQQQASTPQQQQQRSCNPASPDSSITPAAVAAAAVNSATAHSCNLVGLPHCVYNLGGPERLSRYDMAAAVAAQCKHSPAVIKPVKSAEVQRGYCSPMDISMDINQLLTDMPGVRLTSFREGLQQIFADV